MDDRPEQLLYHRLVRAFPEHIVLAQVQASRVLGVKKGYRFHEWSNRINRLSYDFVVCGKDSTVIAAIELDDGTHSTRARVMTDQKKSKASSDAGLRLLRWHVRSLPDEETIRREVMVPMRAEDTVLEPAKRGVRVTWSAEDRLPVVVAKLSQLGTSRPRAVKTLGSTVNALFQKKLNEEEITQLVKELESTGVVSVEGTKVSYPVPA